MRYIETTKEAYELLFMDDYYAIKISEITHELTTEKVHFNGTLGVSGRTIHNFVSNTTQYYLKDINA